MWGSNPNIFEIYCRIILNVKNCVISVIIINSYTNLTFFPVHQQISQTKWRCKKQQDWHEPAKERQICKYCEQKLTFEWQKIVLFCRNCLDHADWQWHNGKSCRDYKDIQIAFGPKFNESCYSAWIAKKKQKVMLTMVICYWLKNQL